MEMLQLKSVLGKILLDLLHANEQLIHLFNLGKQSAQRREAYDKNDTFSIKFRIQPVQSERTGVGYLTNRISA
jgi:hypothetical protein